MKNVSLALYYTRWGAELNQPFVSARTGIMRPQLCAYEKGKTLPSLLSLVALADLYDVSIDYLTGRCDNKEAHKTTKTFKFKED